MFGLPICSVCSEIEDHTQRREDTSEAEVRGHDHITDDEPTAAGPRPEGAGDEEVAEEPYETNEPWTMSFRYRSTRRGVPNGVALDDSGDKGVVGFREEQREISSHTAALGSSFEARGTDDTVIDAMGDRFLVIGEHGAALLNLSTNGRQAFPAEGRVVAGALVPDGLYGLVDDGGHCSVQGFAGVRRIWSLKDSFCADAHLAGTTTGEVFLAHEDLWVWNETELIEIARNVGNLVAVEERSGLVFTAEEGGNAVTARDWNGDKVWTTALGDAAIVAIRAVSGDATPALLVDDEVSAVLLVVDNAPGPRAMALRAEDGSVAMDVPAEPGLKDFAVSGDGTTAALYYDNEDVRFMDILMSR